MISLAFLDRAVNSIVPNLVDDRQDEDRNDGIANPASQQSQEGFEITTKRRARDGSQYLRACKIPYRKECKL